MAEVYTKTENVKGRAEKRISAKCPFCTTENIYTICKDGIIEPEFTCKHFIHAKDKEKKVAVFELPGKLKQVECPICGETNEFLYPGGEQAEGIFPENTCEHYHTTKEKSIKFVEEESVEVK